MPVRDPRIDSYIDKAADFARPILAHLRAEVHRTCPDVVETIKWGFPHFEYQNSILCSMASFKNHLAFGFWNANAMKDPEGILQRLEKSAMGHLGRITTMEDLPPDPILEAYIKEAMRLSEMGFKVVKKAPPKEKKELHVPEDFRQMLEKDRKAKEVFEAFSYSHKKEYLEWFEEAKTEKTRHSRMTQALEWLEEGKDRNWKYNRRG